MVGLPVRATVLFSSTAALFGAPGQGNYAAANAALEAWAADQSQQGQSALAVQWGAWAAGIPTAMLLVPVHFRMADAQQVHQFSTCLSRHLCICQLIAWDDVIAKCHLFCATGMANDASTVARVKRSGLGLLAPASGMQALAALLVASTTTAAQTFAAAPVHWSVLLRGKQAPFFFSEFAPEPEALGQQVRVSI
jgi:hypothetical protein